MQTIIRAFSFTAFSTLLCSVALAQQPATAPQPMPTEGIVVTAAGLAAIIAKQPSDKSGFQSFMQLAPYQYGVSSERATECLRA